MLFQFQLHIIKAQLELHLAFELSLILPLNYIKRMYNRGCIATMHKCEIFGYRLKIHEILENKSGT